MSMLACGRDNFIPPPPPKEGSDGSLTSPGENRGDTFTSTPMTFKPLLAAPVAPVAGAACSGAACGFAAGSA